MFIGHYGPAFAAKPADRRIPLWLLFIAVQWMDIWWASLILLGVERARVVPGFTQGSPLDLYFMPFTHGLAGALLLALLLGVLASRRWPTGRARVALVIAACVFSHWVLDWVVHVPDLPLWANTDKVGLGLWRWAWISVPLEIVTLFMGAAIYARYCPARAGGGLWLWFMVSMMAAVELYNQFAPPPPDSHTAAVMALVAYAVLAMLAFLIERTRQERPRAVARMA